MVRQLSERPGARMGSSPGPRDAGGFDKAAVGSGANIYAAAADDASEHHGYEQSGGSHSGGGGYSDVPPGSHAQQHGGYGGGGQQQQHNPYAGAAGNPYTNYATHSPSSGRYGAAAPPPAWQPANAF